MAIVLQDRETLPGPLAVWRLMIAELQSGELLFHIAITLRRVAFAFVIAMSLGVIFGLIMGRNRTVNRWFDSWLLIFLNLPALVTIVLCYLWIGLTETAAIVAVSLNKIPMVTVMIREGARALDPKLFDMAQVFQMSRTERLRHVVIPQLAPQLAASARTGLALIWKIVLVVEFLGRSNGVGFQIHLYFQLFDVGRVLAYAISFMLVMLVVEYLILQPIENHANRWRHR
ncbi:ABC transporter permease [Paramylibacter ulvae]|uniref:ABC transporter permease n=1 Tax=Paramylibacter ulvae TaxID=1651968 RepID=UPI0035711713